MGIHSGSDLIPQSNTNKKFISGVECINHIGGGCVEVVFYVMETVNGTPVRARADFTLVMPADALPEGIGKSLMAIGRTVYARADGVLALMH